MREGASCSPACFTRGVSMEETGKCSTFYSLAHPNSLICARLFLLKGFSVPFVKVFSLSYVLLHVFVSVVFNFQILW